MFQVSSGPMQSQAFHFLKYATEAFPYSIRRYFGETQKLYSVSVVVVVAADTRFINIHQC